MFKTHDSTLIALFLVLVAFITQSTSAPGAVVKNDVINGTDEVIIDGADDEAEVDKERDECPELESHGDQEGNGVESDADGRDEIVELSEEDDTVVGNRTEGAGIQDEDQGAGNATDSGEMYADPETVHT